MGRTDTDELVQDAAERGIEILPILTAPRWAVPKETDPEECWETWPTANAEFAEFTPTRSNAMGQRRLLG